MGQMRGAAWVKNLSLGEKPEGKKAPRRENRSAAHDLGTTQLLQGAPLNLSCRTNRSLLPPRQRSEGLGRRSSRQAAGLVCAPPLDRLAIAVYRSFGDTDLQQLI